MAKINFKDKVVLIAGGAKNLGGEISKAVAKLGANVVIHYNSNSSKKDAEETVKAVESLGRKAMMIQLDLTNAKNMGILFEEAKKGMGIGVIA